MAPKAAPVNKEVPVATPTSSRITFTRKGIHAVTIPTATSEQLYLRTGDDYFESPGGHIRIFRPRDLSLGLAESRSLASWSLY